MRLTVPVPATITTQDEGSTLSTSVAILNFIGDGVVASGSGDTTTISIAGASGVDYHAGIDEIILGETITIAARKQMHVHGEFINDGTLIIDGKLIILE